MGRRVNPNRKAIPVNIRVRMHRQRKQLKNTSQQQHSNITQNITRSENFARSENETHARTEPPTLKTKLRHWANSYRISKRAIDSLLSVLNSSGISSVPRNHRTLFETPINVEINEIAGGKYWYNGLEKSLKLIFSSLDRDTAISLNFNVDGLPLFNSSKTSFWPILASINGIHEQ